jgi:putative flavoprotein involved in K+ transport
MDGSGGTERFETVVIGGGQAGLSAGYYLKQAGRPFLILDANERVGDNWRRRYDSLRLFTPPWAIRLPGWSYPGRTIPTRDEMADYLESYAARFELPVRNGVHVDRLSREGERYVLDVGGHRIEADNVIVATGAYRDPRVPAFSSQLDPSIVQMHVSAYANPSQLRAGGVLVVGAGNSGADVSLDVVGTHPTWLSGPHRGHVPVDIDSWFSQHVVFHIVRFLFHHVLTIRTPMGRRAREKYASHGDMLVRVKPKWLQAAGVDRVGKTVRVQEGKPVLKDGTVLDVANVIWCTGFGLGFSWIDLPIFGEDGAPMHDRGVVTSEPGLSFVGLPFQYAASSEAIPGVGRDARYVVRRIVARTRQHQGPKAEAPVAA